MSALETATPSEPIVPRPWHPGDALALTFFLLVLNYGGALLVRSVLGSGLSDDLISIGVGGILIAAYALALAIVWRVAARERVGFAGAVALRRPLRLSGWAAAAIGLAFGARVLAVIYGLLLNAAHIELPGGKENLMRIFPGGAVGMVALFLVAVVVAPIAEETVFRGVLLPALQARWGTRAAVVMSSFAFAAIHVNPSSFVPLLLLAMALSWLTLRARSIVPAIICHSAFNAIGLGMFFLLRGNGPV